MSALHIIFGFALVLLCQRASAAVIKRESIVTDICLGLLPGAGYTFLFLILWTLSLVALLFFVYCLYVEVTAANPLAGVTFSSSS